MLKKCRSDCKMCLITYILCPSRSYIKCTVTGSVGTYSLKLKPRKCLNQDRKCFGDTNKLVIHNFISVLISQPFI